MNPLLAITLIKEATPLIKKFIKPKSFKKEGSLVLVLSTGQTLLDQYSGCGFECIDVNVAVSFATAVVALAGSLYSKYTATKELS